MPPPPLTVDDGMVSQLAQLSMHAQALEKDDRQGNVHNARRTHRKHQQLSCGQDMDGTLFQLMLLDCDGIPHNTKL